MVRFLVLFFSLFVLTTASAQTFPANHLTLKSSSFKEGELFGEDQVFNGFGCSGKNRSPALSWTKGPEGTKSYAVMVYDPDAPTGSGWWHWVVYNIPANVQALPTDAGNIDRKKLPQQAIQGRTDFGTRSFGGACPPNGDAPHRYIFTVYALKVEKLDVPEDATAAMIGFFVRSNRLAEASLTAMYQR